MAEKTKACPFCGEEILAVAKKCKHCGEFLEEKNTNKKAGKKFLYGILYVLGILFVLFILLLLRPVKEETPVKQQVQEPSNIVSVDQEDIDNCMKWIEKKTGRDTRAKKVKGEKHTTSLNEHYLSIEGTYIEGKGWSEVEKDFTCIKDLDGNFGKNHTGLYILMVDGDIIAEDMD